jgi:hypothetical protein
MTEDLFTRLAAFDMTLKAAADAFEVHPDLAL